jgi:hypothetical protein
MLRVVLAFISTDAVLILVLAVPIVIGLIALLAAVSGGRKDAGPS